MKESRKRTKQNEDKQPIRCRVEYTGYQDARGTPWVLQQNNTDKAEMKVTPSEIKNNLLGNNSGLDETKNQINDLEHKEEKHMQTE